MKIVKSRRNPNLGWLEVDADEVEVVKRIGFGKYMVKLMPVAILKVLKAVFEHRKQEEKDTQL